MNRAALPSSTVRVRGALRPLLVAWFTGAGAAIPAAVAALTCLTTRPALAQRGAPEPPGASIVTRAPIDGRSEVGFSALVTPDTVFVGQQATYQVGVFLSEQVRARLRRNPQFQPPEVRSTLAFDLPSLPGTLTRSVGNRIYDVHVFQRALFPLTPGTHVIPSARLDYALPLSNSFFAREENHSVRTTAVALVALAPPPEGRPTDYRGAVGRLNVTTRMDRRQARVGDPLTFTVRVDGVANVTLLPRPDLRIPWGDIVPSGERVHLDSSAMLVRGRKDFDWIVTPRDPGPQAFPRVRYPYFNPYSERYEIALTRPESIVVADGAIAARPETTEMPVVPIRREYRGERSVPLPSHAGYWLALAMAPLPAAVLAMRRRPARPRARLPIDVLDHLASQAVVDAATLRRAYAAAMAARVYVTATQMSNHAVLVRTLRRAGVSAETAAAADRMLAELDAIVYGRAGRLRGDAARRALQIVRAIDQEACTPGSLAARARIAAPLLVLLLAAAATAWAAMQDATAQRVFRDGVAAYDARRFADARAAFVELAEARPRAADAWVNVGSASWELGDTAAAAIGWQRAVRLEPMATDIRDLLVLTPGYRSGLLGDVPAISLQWLAVMGALAWLVGWGAITTALHLGDRAVLRVGAGAGVRHLVLRARHGLAAVVLAGLIALAGVAQSEILSGRRAAIVVSPARVRALPLLGADEGAATVTGEVVRILGRQGVWTLARTSDGRRGWLESSRLVTIAVE